MREFIGGNLFLLGSVVFGTAAQLRLKQLMLTIPGDYRLWARANVVSMENGLQLAFVAILLAIGFCLWLASLRYLALTYAYALSSSAILLVAAASFFALGERLPFRGWMALAFLVAGGALLMSCYSPLLSVGRSSPASALDAAE